MTGAQALWAALARQGVSTVFGYPGGAILPAYDAMIDFPIRHVLARHEQGAAHMADGYARATGRPGVVVATSGPGATNLVTGIATAMLDSSPVVCVTGQVGSGSIGFDAFQETDITGVTLPVTKHNYLVTRAGDIAGVIGEAFQLATSGRPGPVLVDITKDAQQGAGDSTAEARLPVVHRRPDLSPTPEALDEAIALIRRARRPVVLAGHGVLLSEASDVLARFVDRAQLPVAMTLLGIGGFPASHPLNLGMMGMHGEAWVNESIQRADLLLAFGMRFDDRATGHLSGFAPKARKIHVDIDPSEIDKNVRVDLPLVGDLREVLEALLPSLPRGNRAAWLAEIRALRGDAAVRDIQQLPDNGHLHAAHVINDLWRVTDGRALIVSDVGQHQMWEAQYYRHERPRSLITSGGLGTMGFALPAAIGAKIARPEEDVWVVVGDGGFQMTMQELGTVIQEEIKLNIAIVNNGYLGMVRQWQEFFYERRYAATPLVNPDFVRLAGAYGLPGRTVRVRAEVAPAVRAARESPQTFVIDFRVEQEDCVYPMVPAGADLGAMMRRPVAPS
ncbi:MAG TPA: biosynthetic-type acetolactate synthase large subunit [Vicinamibacterales bacterium]|jgi:acetolactate synthase-1/2/3 large subunit